MCPGALRGFGKHLGRALGRATEGERDWIDYQRMRGGEVLGETIRAQLAGARLQAPDLHGSPWFIFFALFAA